MIAKILALVQPLLWWLAEIHWPFTKRTIQPEWVSKIKPRLRAGHVFLTYQRGAPTNLVNRGRWKHAAMYLGKGQVIEATHTGVAEIGLLEFCLDKDMIVVLRPKFCEKGIMHEAVKKAREFIGLKYDFAFSLRNKAKYCAEIPIDAYMQVCSFFHPATIKIGDRYFFTPDSIYEDINNWEVVVDSTEFYRKA